MADIIYTKQGFLHLIQRAHDLGVDLSAESHIQKMTALELHLYLNQLEATHRTISESIEKRHRNEKKRK